MQNPLRHAPNVMRVFALALIVGNGVLAVTLKAAADSTELGLRSIGRSALRYSDNRALSGTRTIEMNGARVRFATGSTRDSVRTVLDYYATQCRAMDGGLSEQVRQRSPFRAEVRDHLPREFNEFMEVNEAATMVRFTTDSEGLIICINAGRDRVQVQDFVQRLVAGLERGELTGGGDFRYVYATRPDRPDARTQLIGFWTENSPLNVLRMFPAQGDAPGRAVPSVARPTGMRRVLSAHESGSPLSYTVYSGATPVPALEAQLRRDMTAQGWTFLPLRRSPTARGELLLAFERGQANVMYYLGRDRDGTSVAQMSEEASPIR